MERKVACVLTVVVMLALRALAETESDTCKVSSSDRVNCGDPGIKASECESKGCCFDDTTSGVPWCFYPQATKDAEEDECPF